MHTTIYLHKHQQGGDDGGCHSLDRRGLQNPKHTSTSSHITSSVTHFHWSQIPHVSPCFLCLFLKKTVKKEIQVPSSQILPSNCIFIRNQGQRKERKGSERGKWSKEGRREWMMTPNYLSAHWTNLWRTETCSEQWDQLINSYHSSLDDINWLCFHLCHHTESRGKHVQTKVNHDPPWESITAWDVKMENDTFSGAAASYKGCVIVQARCDDEEPKRHVERIGAYSTSRGWRWGGRTASKETEGGMSYKKQGGWGQGG